MLLIRKLLTGIVLLVFTICKGQPSVSFYQDSFKGGVTSAGFSPGTDGRSQTTSFTVHVPPGSTIRKAYLFAGRLGIAPAITVYLNTNTLVFNNSTQVTPTFQSQYGGPSAVCAVDLTSKLNPSDQNYSITLPDQNYESNFYTDFYLYIAFNNPNLPVVNTAVFLNSRTVTDTIDFTPMPFKYAYLKPFDFGVSMYTGYLCDTSTDGEDIYLNSNFLGLIGSNDINSESCGGPIGSFYYYSDTLHGLNDDKSLLLMKGSDALSNASSVIANCTDSISMRFIHQSKGRNADNNIWGVILAYGGLDSVTVSANPVTASICEGDSVLLTANGAKSYSWSPSIGLNNAYGDSVTAKPSLSTIYTIAGKTCNKTDTATVTITVNQYPDLKVNTPPPICAGASVLLIASGATAFTWLPSDGLSAITGDSIIAGPTITTTYTVSATNAGCTDSVKTILVVDSLPQSLFASYRVDVCNSLQVQFINNSIGGSSYHWSFGDGISSDDKSPIHVYTASGIYTIKLIVTSSAGCNDSIAGIDTVISDDNMVSLPGAFTPGIAGENELFIPNMNCTNYSGYLFRVYDRWGKMVFESPIPHQGWDGNFSGQKQPMGVYVYYLKVLCSSCNKIIKGDVTLIR